MAGISLTKRLSYGAADTAGQLVFCVISFYLLYFYTDVYGISLGAAGTILLIARIIDAIDAPIWGMPRRSGMPRLPTLYAAFYLRESTPRSPPSCRP